MFLQKMKKISPWKTSIIIMDYFFFNSFRVLHLCLLLDLTSAYMHSLPLKEIKLSFK